MQSVNEPNFYLKHGFAKEYSDYGCPYVQTKEKAEHTTHPDEHNAEEYASDRVEGGVDRTTHDAAHQFDKQGRKGLKETKRNVSKMCIRDRRS